MSLFRKLVFTALYFCRMAFISMAFISMASPAAIFSPAALAAPVVPPFEQTNLVVTRIDYSRIADPDYTAELLSKVCRVFTLEEAQRLSKETFVSYRGSAKLPMPHNVKHDFLEKSKYILAVISGSSPTEPERHKAICLNHLAFVISRQIPYYFFYYPSDFKSMNEVYPHALKLPAMKHMLSMIPDNRWVLWIDDDIVTSDFMGASYDQINTLEGEPKQKALSRIRSLPDRVIVRTGIQRSRDDSLPNTPHMIVTKDQGWPDYVEINSGMVWIKNTNTGNEMLDLWWSKTKEDDFPVSKFFCYLNNTFYKKLQDCLEGCGVISPGYYYQCGPSPEQEQWMRHHSGKRFDQDVLQSLLPDPDKNPPPPEIMNNVELIPQKAHFGMSEKKEDKDSSEFHEGINVFFRSHIPRGGEAPSQVGYDPLVDKWVHVTGLGRKQKNAYLGLWLSTIMNYPVRDKVKYSSHDLSPAKKQLLEEGWVCPACEHSHGQEDMDTTNWLLLPSVMTVAFVAGILVSWVYLFRRRR